MKFTTISKLSLTILAICAANTVCAQRASGGQTISQKLVKGEYSVHVGVALPTGNFSEEAISPSGAFTAGKFSAGPGISAGVKGIFPVNGNGLGAFVSAYFVYNGLKGTLKEYYDVQEESHDDVTRHRYINIPLLV
jgi:hypothetical protein